MPVMSWLVWPRMRAQGTIAARQVPRRLRYAAGEAGQASRQIIDAVREGWAKRKAGDCAVAGLLAYVGAVGGYFLSDLGRYSAVTCPPARMWPSIASNNWSLVAPAGRSSSMSRA